MTSWKMMFATELVYLSFLCICIAIGIGCSQSERADPTYIYHFCDNTSTYQTDSLFQTNLNSLLYSIPSYVVPNNTTTRPRWSSASANLLSYNNITSTKRYKNYVTQHYLVLGINGFIYTSASDLNLTQTAYIQSSCRGDLSSHICHSCVQYATTDILKRCPIEKEAIAWYDECILRFSDKSFFSEMTTSPTVYMWNTYNVTKKSINSFNMVLSTTMNDTATKAINSLQRFATVEANINVFQKLYTLAQCMPDITSLDCDSCLQQAIAQIPACCDGKQGGRVYSPSCNIRYEIFLFYNLDTTIAPAPGPGPIAMDPLPQPPPPLSPPPPGKGIFSSKRAIAIVTPIVAVLLFLLSIVSYWLLKRRTRRKINSDTMKETDLEGMSTMEALPFDFETIRGATDEFSQVNKLGGGGFGEVYKGVLPNGQEIAVKRNVRNAREDVEEFKNEIALIGKLQHRNLVRLFGFCCQGDHQILVYEFLPNRSLDCFLHEKQGHLDWSTRYKIIQGIAQGIVYLHHDSCLKIIHRDLKASNILLDKNMIPKISDFGLARIIQVDQAQPQTDKIVGTHGYMPPEYAMYGHFSTKSDVYSFGVLTLEIISGKKNCDFYQTNDATADLQNLAWKHWRNGTTMELVDQTLEGCYSISEVSMIVHVSLLCVQEDPSDRPTMETIVLALNNDSATLPMPKQPTLLQEEPESTCLFVDDS